MAIADQNTKCRLTRAMASAKEGLVLSYHAAVRGAMPPRCSIRISAASVTTLNRPKSAGVTKVWAHDFRSIEAAELELEPLTVLVGPNASGKRLVQGCVLAQFGDDDNRL